MGSSEFPRRGFFAAQAAVAIVILGVLAAILGSEAIAAQPPKAGKAASKAATAAKDTVDEAPAAPPSKYREEKPDETLGKSQKMEIAKVLRSGALTPDTQKQLDAYYTKYVFPRWTVAASHAGSSARDLPRMQLRTDLGTAKSGPVYNHVVALAMAFLKPAVADATRHPAIRYNAILMIGDLDTAVPAAGTRAAVTPLPEALTVLLEALKDPSQIDAVKVGALQGLIRHASAGIADPQIRDAQVIPALLQMATAPVPPGRTPEGHAWMRKLAVEALGAVGSSGAGGAIAKTLASIAGSPDTAAGRGDPFLVRRAAARALGKLNYQGASGVTPVELAVPLGRMLLDAFAEHSRRPATRSSATGTGMGGMGGMPYGSMGGPASGVSGSMPSGPMGGYDGAGGMAEFDPDADRKVQFRRLYKSELAAVIEGLGRYDLKKPESSTALAGFAAATPDKSDDTFFQDVAVLFREQVGKFIDDEEATFAALRRNLVQSNLKLGKLLNAAVPGSGGAKTLAKPAAADATAPPKAPAKPTAADAPTPPKPPAKKP